MNRKLTIFYYDVDDVEELGKNDMDWQKLPFNFLGRNEINVDYDTNSNKYQILKTEKSKKFMESV